MTARVHIDAIAMPGSAAPRPAVEQALGHALRLALPRADGPVLLAVSGGSDSTALLVAAAALRTQLPAHVVHVDHGLRADSGRDAAFVESLARAHGLPVTTIAAPPRHDDPGRTETAARRRRLAALQHVAGRIGATHVLLAHHDDDDLETILLQVLRGHNGDRALAGMPAVRLLDSLARAGVPGNLTLVRPFLIGPRPLDRGDLSEYRRAHGIPARHDPSNADVAIPRNRIRQLLASGDPVASLPTLRGLRHRARARLRRRLAHACGLLQSGLHGEGLGTRIDTAALCPLEGDRAHEHLGELLRLVGLCLRSPRRVDVRATTLRELDQVLLRGSGRLTIPASPCPLEATVSSAGIHLVDEPLRPGTPAAAVLSALIASPLRC